MGFNASNGKTSSSRVAIVAAGVVSPLGFGLTETLRALEAAQDCVTPVSRFPISQCRCQKAGQVNDDRLGQIGSGTKAQRFHRVSRMLIWALNEALSEDRQFKPELTVVGTTSGGMSFAEDYYRAITLNGRVRHTPRWIANYPAQKPIVDAQQACSISVPCYVIANACASGTNAIGHAFECVRSGKYQRVLTGGYDAICELVFVGFDSLQASTPEKCRPFDRGRSGMVLGEGAAIFALENMASAQARGANILAEIIGYGISTDNHHMTQPEPSGRGPRQAMERALQRARVEADQIDYINAHGTATPFNDAAEGKAIAEMFERVPMSSTKAMMGHSLGAAGAIEAIFCLLSLKHQFLPANINFRAGDHDLDLNIVANKPRRAKLDIVLSNSFGFGGTNASILMKKFVV